MLPVGTAVDLNRWFRQRCYRLRYLLLPRRTEAIAVLLRYAVFLPAMN